MNFWQHLCECHFESRYFSAVVNICSKSQKFGNRSSVHARARWNLIWYDFRWLWIKIENWTSGHTDFFISILWTFTLVLRWTFDNTYMNAILNLGTCQPLWTFAVTFRNLEIDPACTRVHAGISFDTTSGGCEKKLKVGRLGTLILLFLFFELLL